MSLSANFLVEVPWLSPTTELWLLKEGAPVAWDS
jgi:hypothetical protein